MPVNAKLRDKLIELVPYGHVATKRWLMEQGVKLHSIDNLVKSNQLVMLVPGVYRRPETKVTWEGLVTSLHMGLTFWVGGLTAIELHGYGHYVPLGKKKTIQLYGPGKLPSWINRVLPDIQFNQHGTKRLYASGQQAYEQLTRTTFSRSSSPGVPLRASIAEAAFLELLQAIPEEVSFDHADLITEGLVALSPRKLDRALTLCTSVKAKRLFFWFADRHRHQWYSKLNVENYDLGKGKRVIAKKGRLDKTYQITVPEELHGSAERLF